MSIVKLLIPLVVAGVAVVAFTGKASASTHSGAPRLTAAQAREVDEAMKTADPRVIRDLATELERQGHTSLARDLRAAADAIADAVKEVPPVKPGQRPVLTAGGPLPSSAGLPSRPVSGSESAERLLAGKVALMLTNRSPGREDKGMVKEFQLAEQAAGNLSIGKADGLYGPKSALALAKRHGIVPPKPYYWPRQGTAQAKADYSAKLLLFATRDKVRAEEWRAAGRVS